MPGVIVRRAGVRPRISPEATIAPGAHVVGDVRIGPGCVVDAGATVIGGGAPVRLERDVVVLANSVIRSVGGGSRPAFAVRVGAESLVGPAAVLAGCDMGEAVYVATQVMVFHGARIGDGTRLGAGCVVHTGTVLPAGSRVGLRQFAVPDGDDALVTGDLTLARERLAAADFFGTVFATAIDDQAALHRTTTRILREEAATWRDEIEPGT